MRCCFVVQDLPIWCRLVGDGNRPNGTLGGRLSRKAGEKSNFIRWSAVIKIGLMFQSGTQFFAGGEKVARLPS